MANYIILAAEIASAFFFLWIVWHWGAYPFLLEYNKKRLFEASKALKSEALAYPELQKDVRRTRAFLRILSTNAKIISIVFIIEIVLQKNEKLLNRMCDILSSMMRCEENISITQINRVIQSMLIWHNIMLLIVVIPLHWFYRIEFYGTIRWLYEFFTNLVKNKSLESASHLQLAH